MLKHIVLWKFADDDDEAKRRQNAITIKAGLEELRYEAEGIVSLEVHIAPLALPTCDADICLEAVFVSRDAFRAYLAHPRHVMVRDFITNCTEDRMCMDFETA